MAKYPRIDAHDGLSIGSVLQPVRQPRIFEMVQNISGPLDGEFNDWPSHIQDAIHKAMEEKTKEAKCPTQLVFSKCDYDIDDGWFVHVVYSEIIAIVQPN